MPFPSRPQKVVSFVALDGYEPAGSKEERKLRNRQATLDVDKLKKFVTGFTRGRIASTVLTKRKCVYWQLGSGLAFLKKKVDRNTLQAKLHPLLLSASESTFFCAMTRTILRNLAWAYENPAFFHCVKVRDEVEGVLCSAFSSIYPGVSLRFFHSVEEIQSDGFDDSDCVKLLSNQSGYTSFYLQEAARPSVRHPIAHHLQGGHSNASLKLCAAQRMRTDLIDKDGQPINLLGMLQNMAKSMSTAATFASDLANLALLMCLTIPGSILPALSIKRGLPSVEQSHFFSSSLKIGRFTAFDRMQSDAGLSNFILAAFQRLSLATRRSYLYSSSSPRVLYDGDPLHQEAKRMSTLFNLVTGANK
jgi:hypothetical protein